MRKALGGGRDPDETARFAVGRAWPGLMALVFGSAQIGDGVTNGWFVWDHEVVVRLVFGAAAVACVALALNWHRYTIMAASAVILVVTLGRSWALAEAYFDSRRIGDDTGETTLLVGCFIWLALALAQYAFAAALLSLTVPRTPRLDA